MSIEAEVKHLKDKINNLKEDMNNLEDNIREEYREAWREYKNHINDEIEEIQDEISNLQEGFACNQERIIKLESALENLESQIDTVETNILSHVQQNGASIADLSDEFRDVFSRLNVVEATSEIKDEQLDKKINQENDDEEVKIYPDWQQNPYVIIILILIGVILILAGYNLAGFV